VPDYLCTTRVSAIAAWAYLPQSAGSARTGRQRPRFFLKRSFQREIYKLHGTGHLFDQ